MHNVLARAFSCISSHLSHYISSAPIYSSLVSVSISTFEYFAQMDYCDQLMIRSLNEQCRHLQNLVARRQILRRRWGPTDHNALLTAIKILSFEWKRCEAIVEKYHAWVQEENEITP